MHQTTGMTAIAFYDVSVASYLQTLTAVDGFLEKARAFFDANQIDLETITETRLYPDMAPLRFQIRSVAHHSLGTIEGLRSGTFTPPGPSPAYTSGELQPLGGQTRAARARTTPEELEDLSTRDLVFVVENLRLRFTAANFVTSFSLPNVFFHATTAYDILRMKGVPLGKRDFLGRPRFESQPSPA